LKAAFAVRDQAFGVRLKNQEWLLAERRQPKARFQIT
jgi:hypothetical protein